MTAHPYQAAPEHLDAFLYSPVFAQLMRPLSWLPWPVFDAGWIVLESGCFWWLTRGLRWWWRVPVLLVAVPEVLLGNVYGLLAVTVALGLRHPGLWAFGLLTKVTTGLPGLVCFAARQEWHRLAELVVVATLLVGVSFVVSPDLWVEWVRFLHRSSGPDHGPLVRVAVATTVVAVAARRGWAAVLPWCCCACRPGAGRTRTSQC